MARSYTTAAKRAAETSTPTDPAGLLAWVGTSTVRARVALRDVQARPVDRDDAAAAAGHQQLVDALLDVFPRFDIDGSIFRVFGEMQLLDLCELMRLNKRNVKTVDPAGVAALADFFAGALGADEYERFREFCRDNCVEQDVLNDVMEGIVEDLSEVPTSRPSHSVPGPSSAGHTSKVVSLSLSQGSVRQDPPMTDTDFQAYLRRRVSEADQDPRVPAGPLGAPTPTTPGYVSYG